MAFPVEDEPRNESRIDLVYALAIACAVVLWHLPGLTLIPGVNHDEIMLNSAARSWSAKGIIALSPLADAGKTYASAYYWHPPGHLLVMAAVYSVFGFSIAVTRGESLASGACAAFLLFILLRRLKIARTTSVILILLFLGHPLVWWLCRSGRMDLLAISFGLAALLFIVGGEGPKGSYSRAALAGVLIGVGSLFHVMTLVWAPAVIGAESLALRRLNWKRSVLIGVMASLPLLLWILSILAVGDREAWMEQFVGYQLMQRSGTANVLSRFLGELGLIVSQLRLVPALLLPLIFGLAAGWTQAPRQRWWCLGGAGVAFLLIACFTAKGTGAYPLYWFVWVLLLAGYGIDALSPNLKGTLVTLAVANAAFLQCAQVGVALYQRKARAPERVDRFFAENIPRGSIVMGPEDIWYAVEHSGSELRIWADEHSLRHDYYVTAANVPANPPVGFRLLAELPDTMPKVFGHYWSHTSCSYRIWVRMK